MHLKIHGGTVSSGGSILCATCRHATIVRGLTLDEEMVHCRAISIHSTRITFKVTSCSAYSDSRLPSYMQLMEQAWILHPGSKKRAAGFVRASDLRDDDFAQVMVDLHGRREE